MKYLYVTISISLILLVIVFLKENNTDRFHRAIDNSDLISAKELLDKGVVIDSADNIEWYPIHTAALRRDESTLKFLLNNGADINVQNKDGWTPLHVAIAASSGYSGAMLLRKYRKSIRNSKDYRFFNKNDWPKSMSMVNTLLENGAEVKIEGERGISSLDVAAITNHTEVISRLVSLDSGFIKIEGKTNALHHAVSNKNLEAVKLLLDLGFDVNAKDNADNTPLHLAVSRANYKKTKPSAIAISELLIERNASVTARNNKEQTPLITAARGNAPLEIIILLLKHNSEIDAQDNEGNTALYYAVGRNQKKPIEQELYINKGADVNHKSLSGKTPLHYAAMRGSAEMINFLISNGAKVNAADNMGVLPIHDAAQGVKKGRGNNSALNALISHGSDINKKDSNGDTPLHYAVHWTPYIDSLEDGKDQMPETVLTLLNNGADINIRNSNNKTPLDIAQEFGEERTVKIIEDYNLIKLK